MVISDLVLTPSGRGCFIKCKGNIFATNIVAESICMNIVIYIYKKNIKMFY